MKVYNLYNNTILIPYLTMENQPKCKMKAIEFNVDLMLQFYIMYLFVNLAFSVFTMKAL